MNIITLDNHEKEINGKNIYFMLQKKETRRRNGLKHNLEDEIPSIFLIIASRISHLFFSSFIRVLIFFQEISQCIFTYYYYFRKKVGFFLRLLLE
jgi:hypothetical protein